MSGEHPELDDLQAAYKAAVETWISSIRKEEALASANHSLIEIDKWEVEERAAGRLQNGAPTIKSDTRAEKRHEDDAKGRVGLPLLK